APNPYKSDRAEAPPPSRCSGAMNPGVPEVPPPSPPRAPIPQSAILTRPPPPAQIRGPGVTSPGPRPPALPPARPLPPLNPRPPPRPLLRRLAPRRARGPARLPLQRRNPDIRDLHPPARPVQDQVSRLHIPVHDPPRMRRRQRLRHLQTKLLRLPHPQRPLLR